MPEFEPRERFFKFIRGLQDDICKNLEAFESQARFIEDRWKREEGGGGWTRVMSDGSVFEKAGVNVSEVYGPIPEALKGQVAPDATSFYATGISLVIHPVSPFVPTCHANYRYFEIRNEQNMILDQWFGGGSDLTPYYLFEEDARHFHREQKKACDRTYPEFYPRFKKWCDEYFYNHHRNEARGIGGTFFDHLKSTPEVSWEQLENFMYDIGRSFLLSYLPIVKLRKEIAFNNDNKVWQEIRRGRYVEFNLIHDRGTLFGLKSNGRIESILMSLPPVVRWEYDHHPEPGSEEARLVERLENPIDWLD
ncbi:MAG: oxygen-dependent coproporphyrinogen oxidase [Saprospiraceae bacterium]|nr:oxygen-dependent coproporphyrinogen oxidase [Saprospiraceae bacterium]